MPKVAGLTGYHSGHIEETQFGPRLPVGVSGDFVPTLDGALVDQYAPPTSAYNFLAAFHLRSQLKPACICTQE